MGKLLLLEELELDSVSSATSFLFALDVLGPASVESHGLLVGRFVPLAL